MTKGKRTTPVARTVSKAVFKARALEFFRDVERTGRELIITDRGKPVLRLSPYHYDPVEALASLRGSVRRFDDPLEPVAGQEWEVLR